MSKNLTARAWKDASFRASLSDAQRAQLKSNPAGECNLDPTGQGKGVELPTLTLIDTRTTRCCA